MSSKSTILELQKSILFGIDPSLIIKISSDNTTIFISNISPETFVNLRLVSNNPSFGTYYFFMNLHVFIGDSLLPTKILGLDQIIESKIRSSDLESFIDNKTFHTPFSNGFRNGLTINQLINRLSLLSSLTPDVPLDAKLRFTLVMDPRKHYGRGMKKAANKTGNAIKTTAITAGNAIAKHPIVAGVSIGSLGALMGSVAAVILTGQITADIAMVVSDEMSVSFLNTILYQDAIVDILEASLDAAEAETGAIGGELIEGVEFVGESFESLVNYLWIIYEEAYDAALELALAEGIDSATAVGLAEAAGDAAVASETLLL
jgi:hypothetical protein